MRALELLAADCGRDSCQKALMLAHGFTIEQMAELVRAGLATVMPEGIVAGEKSFEVARFLDRIVHNAYKIELTGESMRKRRMPHARTIRLTRHGNRRLQIMAPSLPP